MQNHRFCLFIIKKTLAFSILIGILVSFNCHAQAPFITKWKTDNRGTSNSTSITIPTTGGTDYNYDVDWNNDGTFEEIGLTGNITHNYGTAGTYTVAIRGSFPRIYFNGMGGPLGPRGDEEKIVSIEQWGDIAWTSMASAFAGCTNLAGNASDVPNLSGVTDMSFMFQEARAFNQNIGNWNVSAVTNMYGMFYGARAFNQNIGNWNVSAVTNMDAMFLVATAFNQNIGNWDVRAVTNMYGMFANATAFNQNIGAWNIANATNMLSIFYNSGISTTNYDNILIAWNNAGYTNKNLGNAWPLTYCAGQAARTNMTNNKGWAITGDANVKPSAPTITLTTASSVCSPATLKLSASGCEIGRAHV